MPTYGFVREMTREHPWPARLPQDLRIQRLVHFYFQIFFSICLPDIWHTLMLELLLLNKAITASLEDEESVQEDTMWPVKILQFASNGPVKGQEGSGADTFILSSCHSPGQIKAQTKI